MAMQREINEFLENVRSELPTRAHEAYEDAVNRVLQRRHKRSHGLIGAILQQRGRSRRETNGVLPVVTFLLGLLGGASAMWLFDAERGERRRVLLSAQIEQTLNNAVKSLEDAAQQLRDQAQHTTNETEQPLSENAADQALAADVRSIVADYVTDTHAISVTVHDGTAILGGKIHAHEAQPLVERVRSLPGVRSVENRMELHDTPIAPQGWTDPTRSGLG